ncbi:MULTISPECIES: adenylate/guanylate cyclase domain-containing protein [unclassified Mesorhizobium]|uniref:AAA family ATPase n=2 Tax=Mesorhizobium TaxID=68287 RepID=UPI00167982B4|nr:MULTISPECIES: adenylate/guanylate cyclase domain-containing protein [unclassified Mesorhizobium]
MDVVAWLVSLGLGEYAQAFRDNDIDAVVLLSLTGEDLAALGVKSVGHRRKLLDAIASLVEKKGTAAPAASLAKPTASEPIEEAAARRVERRQLTVMFVDLVGSTELSQQLDPEDTREVMLAYQQAVSREITRYEGSVAKLMGDGVLAYFGWPRAHEHDAERAVLAGLAAASATAGLRAPSGKPLAARIGIATGLVVVGDLIGEGAAQEEAVVGDTPNLAARLQGLAQPGCVVVSESTRKLLGGVFAVEKLSSIELKGISAPVSPFLVVGERAVETRYEARASSAPQIMIGRDLELRLALERWGQAKRGEGQLVLLSGEAGIGKSRITRALIDAVSQGGHARVVYQCSPYYSGTPLYPAIQQLRHAVGIAESASDSEKLRALERAKGPECRSVPFLASLLDLPHPQSDALKGLSPQQLRARTLDALADDVLDAAALQPLLFVIEDIHWIDATTLEFLNQCVDRIQNARVMMMVTTRPTFEHGFVGHPIVTKLALNRLGREQTTSFIEKLAGEKRLPPILVDKIIATTDGVPLFIEELTKSVLDRATVFNDQARLADLDIPLTLHDSLMARLDRLQPVKEVAQMAACIGREFRYELLRSVTPLSAAALEDALDKLVHAELVFRRGRGSDARYTFKHALVRDAAYHSMLKTVRQDVHSRLADKLISELNVEPELVAHHLMAARRYREAAECFRHAGRVAAARYANPEAVAHFARALEALGAATKTDDTNELELDVRLEMGVPLNASAGYASEKVEANFLRAEELCRSTGRTSNLFFVRRSLWNFYLDRPDLQRSRDLAQQLLVDASLRGNLEEATLAHRALATSYLYLGAIEDAAREAQAGIDTWATSDKDFDVAKFGEDAFSICRTYLGLAQLLAAKVESGLANCVAAVATAERLDHPLNLAFTLMNLGVARRFRNEPAECRQIAERMLLLADERKLASWSGGARALLGWAIGGDTPDEGLDMLREGVRRWRSTGSELHLPHFYSSMADICLRHGRIEQGLVAIANAMEVMDQTNERWAQAEVERIQGCLVAKIDVNRGMELLADACQTAIRQRARWLAVRAATELAKVSANSGQEARPEYRNLLQVGEVAEGLETAVIREATKILCSTLTLASNQPAEQSEEQAD